MPTRAFSTSPTHAISRPPPPPNPTAPTAAAAAPQPGQRGLADPEGKPLRYEWRLMPAGRVLSTEAAPSVALEERATFRSC
ncbi:MAG: hypothetical protein R3F11_19475 [Verrucomicrobiales bacterium]